ncbi:MAG: TRAP transporter substrate-binding protein DctP [Ignavibacteriales bacterium]|nr:TRAP transporter substrate-binding protein DctP [Ignavibacteriales bacterium]
MKSIASTVALMCILASWAFAQQFIIKFATVAPEGSTWMNTMREYDAAVRKESGGRVGFKIYGGSVQGDERAVLKKIRIGQLQAGGFTGVAMGEVAPMVRILDTPFLVRTTAEADFIYKTFNQDFEKAFLEGGYVLLGWAEVGFVHVFTNSMIAKPDDLKSLKMWVWEGDPVAETAFKVLGLHPTPLSLENVLTSLQTGLVNAFYTSPYAAIALQWYTKAKYIVDVPLTCAAGAVLISKAQYDVLPKDLQEILVASGRKYMAKLTELSRRDNAKAMEEFKKRGLTFIKASAKDIEYYTDAGVRARRELVGKNYSQEFLTRVETALAEFRNGNAAKGSK